MGSKFGWTGNMQKIIQSQTHSKSQDMQRDYYLNQKKALEINPRHPLIKELLRRVEDNPADTSAKEMAIVMFHLVTSHPMNNNGGNTLKIHMTCFCLNEK